MNDSLRAQLSELEVDGDVPNLKEKINNLAAASEKMLKKNENLLEMVELGDEHIKKLEAENKKMQQRIDVLEKKLQKGKTQKEDDFKMHEDDAMNEAPENIDEDFEFRKRERPEETVMQQQPKQPEETVQQQQPEKVHVDEQKEFENIEDDFFNDNLNKLVEEMCQDPKRTVPEAGLQMVS